MCVRVIVCVIVRVCSCLWQAIESVRKMKAQDNQLLLGIL